jgi:hypothetical protein
MRREESCSFDRQGEKILTRYPIPAEPEQAGVTHFIEVVGVEPTEESARRVSDCLKAPTATRPQERCHICGAMLTIPDGSFKGHMTRHLAEIGGEDVYVHIGFRHRGPAPSTPPPGMHIVTEEEMRELRATGRLGFPPNKQEHGPTILPVEEDL